MHRGPEALCTISISKLPCQDDKLKCECATHPFFQSAAWPQLLCTVLKSVLESNLRLHSLQLSCLELQVYLSKHLCKDQFCRDDKFPILDYNADTKDSLLLSSPSVSTSAQLE